MRKIEVSVPLSVARSRSLRYLFSLQVYDLAGASDVGCAIWIGNRNMKAQGLGGAASRILKTLTRDGLAEWRSTGHSWGYKITSKGRVFVINEAPGGEQ